jgi:hypothetical protein
VGGRHHRNRLAGDVDAQLQAAGMDGREVFVEEFGGLCVMSRKTQSRPWRFISKSMARATMSRGASSARRRVRHEALPSGRRSRPPSPRRASVIRKDLACGWYRQVGWNWMNSMFATRQPARQAMAMPSPVAVSGLVV